MASLNSSASSSQCPSNGGHPTDSADQYHPPLSCPTERVPYPPATTTPRPGYGSAPPTGVASGISPSLVHFLDVSAAAACPIQGADVHEPVDKWKHYLVGYVAGKFPGYSAMLSYINRTWQHEVHFSMHDSGWLLFDFSSEIAMLDVLGSGPYAIFGRPIVLQIMPEFFDFQFTEITSMPTWVRFPNLPLRCWNNICLSKIASMVGKPIHCDGPTAQMTHISYARVDRSPTHIKFPGDNIFLEAKQQPLLMRDQQLLPSSRYKHWKMPVHSFVLFVRLPMLACLFFSLLTVGPGADCFWVSFVGFLLLL
ncbi:hypothetical protein NC653_027627 [Populus alba x Populus x berolinensis]|uniref:DUF4283 domain-containing protein n=1 Tax=Populus alba x Populus x berolinensis TaxID=444605 RepID=A0AAD6M5T4_9ROSI|nr:hypothetical protein NC653_027627 [Populus alba x Populus x berolinensis]